MKTLPKITTIIPTFDRSNRLQKAIQSVLDQTYGDFRIFVCDNASRDDTKDVVMSFAGNDSRIQYYCQPSTVSVYENWQTGLDHVETPYYNFLADDDFVLPWFYEMAIAALENEPSVAFFSAGILGVNDQGEIIEATHLPQEGIWKVRGDFKPDTVLGDIFPIYGNMYRRVLPDGRLFMKFHEKLTKYLGFADIGHTLRLLFNYSIINTAQFGYCYRCHNANAYLSLSYSKTEYKNVERAFEETFENDLDVMRVLLKNTKRKWDLALFRNSISNIIKGQSFDTNRFYESHPFWFFLLHSLNVMCHISLARRCLRYLLDSFKSRRMSSHFALQEKYGDIVSKYNVLTKASKDI